MSRRAHPGTCVICGQGFLGWTEDQETCTQRCARTRDHQKNPARLEKLVASIAQARAAKKEPRQRAQYRTVEEARAARLYREWQQGRRTYTIDPWEQRPSAGDINFNADTQGSGYR